MTLQPFNYIPADTLQTAEALLREHGERAAVLAGGTDLLGALKDAIHDDPPALVIGLKPADGAALRGGDAGRRADRRAHHAQRDCEAPGDPRDLSAPGRSRGQRGLAANPQRRDDRRQPLPGAALLVLPQPRQHLRLPAQGRPVVRRALRREPLPLDLRRHVRQRRAVRVRLPHPQRHPRVHGRTPGRQSGRSGRDPVAHQPAGGHHGPGVRALLRGRVQPVRLRRAGVDPRRRAHPRRLCAGTRQRLLPGARSRVGENRGGRRRGAGRADRGLLPAAAVGTR